MAEVIKKEIKRFLVTGVLACSTDAIVYFILVNWLEHSPAKALSFITGIFVAYLMNKFWTFEKQQHSYSEVLRMAIMYTFTLSANVLVNQCVLNVLPSQLLIGFGLATGTSMVLNFILSKWWVFRSYKI